MKIARNIPRRAALGGLLAASAAAPLVRRRLAAVAADELDRAVSARRLERHVCASRGGLCRPASSASPIVVENRGGAGGTLGASIVSRARPDGCTLLVGNTSLTFAPVVYAEFGLRPAARLRADLRHRRRSGRPGRQSRQARRQGSGGLPGGGAASRRRPSTSARRAWARWRTSRSSSCSGAPASSSPTCPIAAAARRCRICSRASSTPPSSRSAPCRPTCRPAGCAALAVATRQREPLLPNVPTFAEAGVAGFQRQHLVRPVRAQGHAGRAARCAARRHPGGAGRGRRQAHLAGAGRAGRPREPQGLRRVRGAGGRTLDRRREDDRASDGVGGG